MEVTVFLLPVPLQVIRSRDSFTPRTTGIQLLLAVVESISSCRKQFDIQHKRKNSRRRRSSKRPWRYQRPNKKSKLLAQISKILQDYQWSYCWDYYCCYRERRTKSIRSIQPDIFKVQGQIRWSVERSKQRFDDRHTKEVRHKPSLLLRTKFYWRPLRFGFCEETILSNYHSKYENTSK